MLGWLKQTPALTDPHPNPHRPDAQWIAQASQLYPHTPDIWWLTRRHFQLLFVYGTQMRGHPQHELVMNYGAYAATTYTDGKFSMWKKRLGKESFPIALEGSGWRRPDWDVPKCVRVQGELYAIDTKQLIELDKHFENTMEFERKRVPLVLPYKKLYKIPYEQSAVQKAIAEAAGGKFEDQVVTTESCVDTVKAWMYIGHSKFWDGQLEHMFAPVKTQQPRLGWLGDYYAFTKEEYTK